MKSLGQPAINQAWLQRALKDENVQYALLALYWVISKPVYSEYEETQFVGRSEEGGETWTGRAVSSELSIAVMLSAARIGLRSDRLRYIIIAGRSGCVSYRAERGQERCRHKDPRSSQDGRDVGLWSAKAISTGQYGSTCNRSLTRDMSYGAGTSSILKASQCHSGEDGQNGHGTEGYSGV